MTKPCLQDHDLLHGHTADTAIHYFGETMLPVFPTYQNLKSRMKLWLVTADNAMKECIQQFLESCCLFHALCKHSTIFLYARVSVVQPEPPSPNAFILILLKAFCSIHVSKFLCRQSNIRGKTCNRVSWSCQNLSYRGKYNVEQTDVQTSNSLKRVLKRKGVDQFCHDRYFYIRFPCQMTLIEKAVKC